MASEPTKIVVVTLGNSQSMKIKTRMPELEIIKEITEQDGRTSDYWAIFEAVDEAGNRMPVYAIRSDIRSFWIIVESSIARVQPQVIQ